MTKYDPLWAQGGSYSAREDRLLITNLWDEGVLDLTSFRVTERAGGANFTVDISAGTAVVAGDVDPDQGSYLCRETSATTGTTVSSAPSAGNSRIDLVVLEVRDHAEDGGGSDDWRFRVVAGTPTTGTPSVPSTPSHAIPLATIGPITNSTTSITDSLISDVRPVAGRRCTPGTMESDASTRLPSGWLWCDGSAVSRTTYARLFAHIGTSWGAGDGATTFNLPDYRGRVMVGSDALGGADAHRLDGVSGTSRFTGGTGGEALHVLTASEMPSHTHSGPSHFHTMNHDHPQTNVLAGGQDVGYGAAVLGPSSGAYRGILLGSGTNLLSVNIPNYTGNTGNAGTGATGPAGSGNAHNNMQPWAICTVRIRT